MKGVQYHTFFAKLEKPRIVHKQLSSQSHQSALLRETAREANAYKRMDEVRGGAWVPGNTGDLSQLVGSGCLENCVR